MITAKAAMVSIVILVAGCAVPGSEGETVDAQGVAGTVWFRPDYDHSDVMLVNDPPDTTPRPLPGTSVYLLKYPGTGPGRDDILAVTLTDSLGRYELRTSPGTYYLAVQAPIVNAPILRLPQTDTLRPGLRLNDLRIVEILPGRIAGQSFEVGEIVPQ